MFSPKSHARPSSGDPTEPAAGHSRSASVASEADSLAEARDVSGASLPSRVATDDVAPFPASPPQRAPSSSGGDSEDEADDPDADDDSMDVMGAAARVGVASSDTDSQTYRNFDLAVRMSAELGVREHRRHLKKHKACFTGRAAVQWMIDAGIAEDVPAAVARGAALVDAGLVRGITAERAFQNRSFLYRFNVAMDPGLQAARWCLSREMTKMQGRVHDVCSVVDRHTAATRAIATDHAAAMERLEKVLVDVRTQLAYTRAACFMIAAACASLLAIRAVEEDDATGSGSAAARSFRSWAAAAGAAAGWETRLRAAATVAAFALFALSAAFVTDGKSLDVVLHTAGVEGWTDPWADEEKDEDDETTEMDSVAARASRVGLRASATKGSATTATTTATATTIVPGTSTVPGTPAAPASVRVASGSVAATSSSTPRTPGSATRNLRRLGSIHRLIRGVSASVSSPGSRRSVSAESLGAGEDAFVHRSLPPPAAWSEAFANGAGAGERAPVGIRLSPERPHQWLPSGPARARDGVSCPTQVPFAFESELFSGVAVVYLRGLPDSPSRVFDGKARAIQFTVQGRFKKPVPMDDLHFGVRLARPMRKLPTRWLLQLCTRVVRSLGAPYSMELTDPTHPNPRMFAPIALACQTMSCNAPGEEPDVTLGPVEDTARISWLSRGDAASGGRKKAVNASERRRRIAKIIRDAKKARGRNGTGVSDDGCVPSYDTENVWTFSFWQAQIDFAKYGVDLGVGKFDLIPILDGQPLTLQGTRKDGSEIAFRFEVWHERLLAAAHAHAAPDDIKERPPPTP